MSNENEPSPDSRPYEDVERIPLADVAEDARGGSPQIDYISRNVEPQKVTPPPWRDYRLYLPQHEGWQAVIKQTWEQEYCYARHPGEDWFHFLANGEIYVQRGAEKYCLTCALRHKILTHNRLFWQRGSVGPPDESPT